MRVLTFAVVVLAGCQGSIAPLPGDSPGLPSEWEWDGGFDALDAGAEPVDAGVFDAGAPVDAGALDAGLFDAGFLDAGAVDAGIPDSGAGIADAGAFDAGPSSLRQVQRTFGTTDAGNGFYEYLPPNYGDGVPRPLLVFWHGFGENGNGTTELSWVLMHGPPKLISLDQWPNAYPFIVLSPQHTGGGCPSGLELERFFAFAIAHYQVDLKRLYLTGLSCGAIASWSFITATLDAQIAAAVLVAGDPGSVSSVGSAWGTHGCNLGRVPIWSFHGDADFNVDITNARNTMSNLIACPQPPRHDAIFTVYPGVGHDSWTRTYDGSAGHDVYAWLLQQAKP